MSTPEIETPWDIGMQNERTRLAWQRTMLAGLACSLLVARLLAPSSLGLSIAIGLAAVLSTAALAWISIRRYVDNNSALQLEHPIGDARSQAIVAALVILTAIGSVVYVVLA